LCKCAGRNENENSNTTQQKLFGPVHWNRAQYRPSSCRRQYHFGLASLVWGFQAWREAQGCSSRSDPLVDCTVMQVTNDVTPSCDRGHIQFCFPKLTISSVSRLRMATALHAPCSGPLPAPQRTYSHYIKRPSGGRTENPQ
jgi:hypothetical protein